MVFGLVALYSCQKAAKDPVIGTFDKPVMQSPATGDTYVLTEDNASQTFETFSWSAADFGYNAAVSYILQFDRDGNGFAEAKSLATTTQLEVELTVGELNNVLLSAEYLSDVASDVEFRIMGEVSDNTPNVFSKPITLTITPFEMIVDYPKIYVPGSHQGWAPDNPNTFLASKKSDDKYEGYINFPDDNAEFKFTPEPNWDNDWGDDGFDGTLDAKGANIPMAVAGYYKMNVDINALTYTVLKTEWGLIGSATPNGWDSDQDMTYDATNDVWTITLDLVDGEIKFRANDDWGLNYGDTGGDKKLEEGGDNIPVTAGNYTITLDLGVPPIFRYTIVKN